MKSKCWLGVVSKEHVQRGKQGNYVQVCHGKKAPLALMKAGDRFVYYSPTVEFKGKDKCQSFTAVGVVRTGIVYQFEMFPGFIPFRCDVDFVPSQDVKLSDLKGQLEFTQGNYGMLLKRGHIEISERDFNIIATAMGVNDIDHEVRALRSDEQEEGAEEKKKPNEDSKRKKAERDPSIKDSSPTFFAQNAVPSPAKKAKGKPRNARINIEKPSKQVWSNK